MRLRLDSAIRKVTNLDNQNVNMGLLRKEDEIDLSVYWHAIKKGRYLIGAIFLSILGLAVLYLLLATRIYHTDAILQFDINEKSDSALEDISGLLTSSNETLLAEIEAIKSRRVLGAVVDELYLQNIVKPVYFPIFGQTLSRYYKKIANKENGITLPPLWGLSGYAWGGEEIEVSILNVPEKHMNQELKIIAGENGRYRLLARDGNLILTGLTGRLEKSGDGTVPGKPDVEIQIDKLYARAGIEFTLKRVTHVFSVLNLQKKVIASEKGKQTGIVQLSIDGPDREQNKKIINTIVDEYTQQNISRKLQEISNMLVFINDQLPALKEDLENAEAKLNLHYEEFGTVNVELETHTRLSQLTEIEKRISSLELALVQYEYKYTKNNPHLIALEKQLVQLETEKQEINQRLARLPGAELSAAKHLRDVQIATDIHDLLVKKAQELEIAQAGIIGSAYVLDRAIIPTEPVRPNKRLVLLIALFLGLFLGVFAVLLRRVIVGTVDSEKMVAGRFDVPVLAGLPHSVNQQCMDAERGNDVGACQILASRHIDDPVIEGMLSFRTNLQFSHFRAGNGVMVVTSPGPGSGKTFFSLNLAYMLACAGNKILLIDGDMRKGTMHKLLNMNQSPGLIEILEGNAGIDDAVQNVACKQKHSFDFLAKGMGEDSPVGLLMRENSQVFLASLKDDYDVVIIRAPSISEGQADAALFGHLTDAMNLLLVRAGQHTLSDIEFSLHAFMKSSAKVNGIVINDLAVN